MELTLFALPQRTINQVLVKNPVRRPSDLAEMSGDIENVIASIAGRYTDPSCPQLNYDDLISEGRLKLSELITKGLIERLPNDANPTRADWFKFFKTVVNNHIKGLVHRYRGTLKRTGHRIPSKDERMNPFRESTKPIEISKDDPDAHVQIAEEEDYRDVRGECELVDHIKSRLTRLEQLVLDQLVQPNEETWFWAVYDSFIGVDACQGGAKIRIKDVHKAKGLGMPLDQFLQVQATIQNKYAMSQNEQLDVKYNAAVASLSTIFNVQVPDSIKVERDTVARLMTMVSRRESEKVTPDVKELLILVGACPPGSGKGLLDGCFGVMYEAGNRICGTCDVQDRCQDEAMTHGITGSFAYTTKLLGSKTVRAPVLTGRAKAPVLISEIEEDETRGSLARKNERDDEVVAHLSESFKEQRNRADVYLTYRDPHPDGKVRYIFWLKRQNRLVLRFCNPSSELSTHLTHDKNGYYLPAGISASEAIALIDRHAKDRFTRKR